ncbi:MAG: cell wall-active antibiotics response protein [Gemmatimonadota bacterium]|nr:cell wall-active antibiotics response protein [Gemmatimonadota bacterium]
MKLAAREIRPNTVTPPYRVRQAAEHGVLVRTLPEDLIPELSRVVAWWTTEKREGEWVVPREFKAFACMGTVELDLTYARMGAGISDMELNGFMANIEVTVPADVRVECDGDEMLGHFDVKRAGNADPPPDAPTLRISGTAYVGSITIKIVDPNAPGWAERLKARWESLKVKASV